MGYPAPIRPVLEADCHAAASAARRAAEGKGLSLQTWGIVSKVREVDECVRADHRLRAVVSDKVPPELCFAQMNGGVALTHSKRKAEGRAERVEVLRRYFGASVDEALASRPRGCAADDLLDAFACAWTARRVALGQAHVIPAEPSRDRFGLPMEMVI